MLDDSIKVNSKQIFNSNKKSIELLPARTFIKNAGISSIGMSYNSTLQKDVSDRLFLRLKE